MHKRIGIIGGMSPESTIEYYRYITRSYVERYGDHGYPEIIIFSVTFQPYTVWPYEGRWDSVAKGLSEAARILERAGADLLIIATNTMHMVYSEVQAKVSIPVVSLMDAVAEKIKEKGLHTVGVLGTKYTMELPFYRDSFHENGITVLIPDSEGREFINRTIYDELIAGKLLEETRIGYKKVIEKLAQEGAQGVILGCTEIPLLIRQNDVDIPLFDTTAIHAQAALDKALQFG